LRQTAVFLNMFPINRPEVLVAYSPEKFDANGNLIDEPTRKIMHEHLVALTDWANRIGK